MGFWSKLGRIGMIAAPIGAAPFTGGASLAALPSVLGTAGKIAAAAAPALGALAQGRAAGRAEQNQANNQRDYLNLNRYRLMQDEAQNQNAFNQRNVQNALQGGQLDLERRGFALNAPQHRASNSIRGDYLANARNSTIQFPQGFGGPKGIPTLQRGFGPSDFSENTRSLGRLMSSQALAGQQAGDQFADLPSSPEYVHGPTAPPLTEMPSANALDKILSTAGTLGSIYGSFDDFLNKYKYRNPGIRSDRPNAGGTGLPIGNPGMPVFGGWADNG